MRFGGGPEGPSFGFEESHVMLGKVIEGGPNLDPAHAAHIRKMIALRMCGLPDIAARAARDQEFYGLAIQTVRDEIEELRTIPGAEELPDMWDIALQDLLGLEGEDPPNTRLL